MDLGRICISCTLIFEKCSLIAEAVDQAELIIKADFGNLE